MAALLPRLPSHIVLASASPRRRELLEQIGIKSIVVPAHIDELAIRDDDPARLAVELARAKAIAVARRLAGSSDGPGAVEVPDGFARSVPLLAADTVVAVPGEILEKPDDEAEARRMLGLLAGRTHQVITGLAMLRGLPDGGEPGEVVTTWCVSDVTFASLDTADIDAYVTSGEWRGVAGGYRIQGLAAALVTHLAGSYSNVVGLPLHLVSSILTGHMPRS